MKNVHHIIPPELQNRGLRLRRFWGGVLQMLVVAAVVGVFAFAMRTEAQLSGLQTKVSGLEKSIDRLVSALEAGQTCRCPTDAKEGVR